MAPQAARRRSRWSLALPLASVVVMALLAVGAMVLMFGGGTRTRYKPADMGLRMLSDGPAFGSLERLKGGLYRSVRTWHGDPHGGSPCSRGCD
jgi:hypothetical protein